jgi:hypothetical protein
MLRRFFQRAWSVVVTAARFLKKCAQAVADAVAAAAVPLHAIRGDANLAHAAQATTKAMVSPATLARIGADVQWVAAKGVAFSSKCGLAKVAGVLAKVVAANALAVGTTLVSVGLTILFVGAIWALKRAFKNTKEFIETASSVNDTAETIDGFAKAA